MEIGKNQGQKTMINTRELLIKALDVYRQEYLLLLQKRKEREVLKEKIWRNKEEGEKAKAKIRIEIQILKKGCANKGLCLYISPNPFN